MKTQFFTTYRMTADDLDILYVARFRNKQFHPDLPLYFLFSGGSRVNGFLNLARLQVGEVPGLFPLPVLL